MQGRGTTRVFAEGSQTSVTCGISWKQSPPLELLKTFLGLVSPSHLNSSWPCFQWGIGLDNVMLILWTPTTGFWKGHSINWAFILTGVAVLMYKNNTRKRVVHVGLEGREARQQQEQCVEANFLQLAFHLWFRMDCYCQKMPPEYSFKLTCLDLLFSRWGLFPLNARTG